MRIVLAGGFGEKGRVAILVSAGRTRVLLDCGVNTSATEDAARYPALSRADLAALDAIVVTHSHEDHVGALGWAVCAGFSGDVYATAIARDEVMRSADDYAAPEHRGVIRRLRWRGLEPGAPFTLGDLRIDSGRSGHVAGGVWVRAAHAGLSVLHCGDVVPASPVFTMDPLPASDVLFLDASYGDDAGTGGAATIRSWLAGRSGPLVMPTPLFGRSLELAAILAGGRFAAHPETRQALLAQCGSEDWLCAGLDVRRLRRSIADAETWSEGDPLPDAPLLVHDGMGLAGPSAAALERAAADGVPVLLTGHLPSGSPGERLLRQGAATWIRMPTHPELTETLAIAAACGPAIAFAHSCTLEAAARLQTHLPALALARTGDAIDLASMLDLRRSA